MHEFQRIFLLTSENGQNIILVLNHPDSTVITMDRIRYYTPPLYLQSIAEYLMILNPCCDPCILIGNETVFMFFL
jgi:hypothetical protein